ncbi:MAG: GDSL-type esterase/lipase family protein, partial [Chloroflexota bacterium]|nr:GDSL-type esterase/lipase family protein [Chloroflexota bacterium]
RRPVPIEANTNSPAPVPTPTEEPPLVYAAIGASDVVGVGASDPFTQSWVNMLHKKMPESTRFVRLGRGGIILREANQIEVPGAVAAQPDIVTMWNCVNDAMRGISLEEYMKDFNAALSRLTRDTDAHVLVLNLPDVTILTSGLIDAQQRALIQGGIRQWNKAMADAAASYGGRVTIVDIFPISNEVLDHPEYISADNFHPSSAGYSRLAEVVWDTIAQKGLLKR